MNADETEARQLQMESLIEYKPHLSVLLYTSERRSWESYTTLQSRMECYWTQAPKKATQQDENVLENKCSEM